MKRKEVIADLVKYDIESFDTNDGMEQWLEDVFTHGMQGYTDYSDEALIERYEDVIGEEITIEN